MKQINLRALIILPFAAIGPIVTVFFIWQGENYRPNVLMPAIAFAGLLIVLTAISAFIVRKLYPTKEEITGNTIGISYILTMVTVAFFSFPDALFAIGLIFGSIFSLPTILPFSFFWSEFLRSPGPELNNMNTLKKGSTSINKI